MPERDGYNSKVGSLIRWLDLGVVGAYLLALTSLGLGFAREQNTSERYFLARRAISSWAIGMSIMATLVTTVTFLAYPGRLYPSSWPILLPGVVAAGDVADDVYRQAGRPITSSLLESAVKQINQRVKGSEKFGSEGGSEAVLQLRADHLSAGEPLVDFWQRRQAAATGQRRYRRTG